MSNICCHIKFMFNGVIKWHYYHDLGIYIPRNATPMLGVCRLLDLVGFPVHLSDHVVELSGKAWHILRDLPSLGVDVVSLMMTKAGRKLVNVLYRGGHPNDDTFRMEGNSHCPYASCECELLRITLGIKMVYPSLKMWMSHGSISLDTSYTSGPWQVVSEWCSQPKRGVR